MNQIIDNNKMKKSKSVCFTPIPINAALKAADDWLGKDLPWSPVNETQKEYLEKFFEKDTAEYDFVKRIASDKREEIKKFLADNGFPKMQVPEIKPPSFLVAGIIDHIVKWLYRGKTTKMKGKDGNLYNAVEFDNNEVEFEDNKSFRVFKSSNYPHPIAVLNTKTEDKVYLTFLDDVNDDETQFGFEMMELTQSITNEIYEKPTIWIDLNSHHSAYIFTNVIIPKIDFEGDVDVNWIVGMITVDSWFIGYAKMKAKLRLNHIGARAQAAAMFRLDCTPPPPKILKFDRPFMIWFTHKGKVTFVMYVDYEHWKDPGDNIFGDADSKDSGDEQTGREEKKSTIFSEQTRQEEEKRNILVYQLNDNDEKPEFEQLKLKEDVKLYELLDPSLILLFLDPDNFKSWLWQGSEASTRMKFISANLAPSIRDQHGMMKISTADDGNERMAFKILVGLEKPGR